MKDNIWNITMLEASLNLRRKKGCTDKDYCLKGDVALAQLQFAPDVIANVEDMECNSSEYDEILQPNYKKVAATEDWQNRGVSCWVKKEYQIEKISSMTDPHFLHVRINNSENDFCDFLILRILVAGSDDKDFKDRREQWKRVLSYIDSIDMVYRRNLFLAGDFNHGVIADSYSEQQARRFFNYQQIDADLKEINVPLVLIDGYSYQGYMKIDHLAAATDIRVKNARYEKAVFQRHADIGVPDHSFVVADLQFQKR